MGIEVNPIENEVDDILSGIVEEFQKEELSEEVIKEEVKEEPTEEVVDIVEEDKKEVEDDTTEEVVDEEEIDEKESDLNESLRGVFNKDYIKLLESIEDPELRDNFIEEGKKSRSELDRKRLELGETKKLVETLDDAVKANGLNYNRQQYGETIKNYMDFDALFNKDPRQAIELLAKQANIELNTPQSETVQDEDDYRLPEEIARDNKLQALEQELNLIKNQRQQQEQVSVQQELNDFANTKDADGELKYPHFEKVRKTMGFLFNDENPDMTMDRAYNKAIMLDDELISIRDADILRKAESKRKVEIEKAKKLKRQSTRSSKVNSTISDPAAALDKIVGDFLN